MSRRCHHGSPRHTRVAARERQRPASPGDRTVAPTSERRVDAPPDLAPPTRGIDRAAIRGAVGVPEARVDVPGPPPAEVPRNGATPAPAPGVEPDVQAGAVVPALGPRTPEERPDPMVVGSASLAVGSNGDGFDHGATAPQLRRFIKSRAYVPMHELRRRFGINGGDDEVSPVDLEAERVFVGLPPREGRLLAELLRAGDIGYELSMDPITPIVVGVYPMRPVPRG